MTPLLETERLRLRAPSLGDAKRIAELLDNFVVAGNLSKVPVPYGLADAEAWLGRWRADAPPAETNFIIQLKTLDCVGVVGFHNDNDVAHIGYWLGEPFWGRGIMTEAVRRAVSWYFNATNANEIISGIFHFNNASWEIQKKMGFVEVGQSSLYCLARDENIAHIDTKLTRAAFFAAHQQ